jgi:hypothetical protein
MVVREFLNNIEIQSLNRSEFRLTIDYLNSIIVEDTDLNDIQLGLGKQGDAADPYNIVQNWILSGKALEPIPYRREIQYNNVVYTVFDGFMNAFEAEYSNETLVARVYQRNGLENLQRLMDSTTFDYLFGINVIKPNDFIFMPYVVRRVPFAIDVYLMGFSIFVMTIQLLDQVNELIKQVTRGANPFETPGAVLNLITTILFIITLLIAIVDNLVRIFQYIIQPVKYHACMRVKTMLEKGFEHIGFQFRSTILEGLYKDAVILPEKFKSAEQIEGLLGLLKPINTEDERGYYKGSLSELINSLSALFNGKLFIKGNEVRLERRDYKPSAPLYTLSGVFYETYKFNSEEYFKDIEVSFLTDLNDKNTIQQYDGTAFQIVNRPKGLNDITLWQGQGIETRLINFSLAKRKNQLYGIERAFAAFYDVLNGVQNTINVITFAATSAFNAAIEAYNALVDVLNFLGANLKKIDPIPLPNINEPFNPINNRIGLIEMSNDDVAVPKIFIIDEHPSDPKLNSVAPSNAILFSAEVIYNLFHSIDSFVPTQTRPTGNQYKRWRIDKDKFTIVDFLNVRENAYIYNEIGKECELERLVWDVEAETAEIDFREPHLYIQDFDEIKININGK